MEETKRFNCVKCKDLKLILYRVHKDTAWIEEKVVVNGEEQYISVPENMVLEDDLLTGKICTPDKAWEWKDSYSKQCDCINQVRIRNLLKASEITDAFKKLGFRSFVVDDKPQVIVDAYQCALNYFKEFAEIRKERCNSISLLGQPGSGKTHLLTAIANNLISKGISVLYFPYVEGFNDLKDDFSKLEEKLERMKKVDVLFVDDLFKPAKGVPRATEWTVEQIYAVINYRYLNHMPILISSELTVDELVDVDEALGTRIYQMCKEFTVVIKGDRKQLNHRLEGLENV